MNDVVKFGAAGTGLMSREDLARSFNNVAMVAPSVGGDKQFLKMDKGNGDWVYGQEETLVEDGSKWAINPQSFEYGYIAWDMNQQVEGEVMVPITRPLPAQGSLRTKSPDGNTTGQNGWQYQQSMDLQCIGGEDDGTVCQYKQSSVGSQKAFKGLIDAISGQIAKGSDAIVPVIVMKSDSYKHKKWGRINNPIFEIVEWRTMDGSVPEAEAKEPERAPRRRAPSEKQTVSAGDVGKLEDVIGAGPTAEELAEEAALKAEYEAEQAAAAANPTPRRRVRR
jgi:hypothetical protein